MASESEDIWETHLALKMKSFLTALCLYLLPAPLTICYQVLYCFLLLGIAVKLEKKWKKKKNKQMQVWGSNLLGTSVAAPDVIAT